MIRWPMAGSRPVVSVSSTICRIRPASFCPGRELSPGFLVQRFFAGAKILVREFNTFFERCSRCPSEIAQPGHVEQLLQGPVGFAAIEPELAFEAQNVF